MQRWLLAATAVILFLPVTPIGAAELMTTAPITDVTVYPDRAEVTRSIEVRVPQGITTLIVHGLPTDILPQSIRAFGKADGEVQVTTVSTELIRPATVPFVPDPKIEPEIRALEKQKPPIEARIAMAQMQMDYYKLMLAEAPQISDKELIRSLDPKQWDSVWAKLSAKLADAQAAMLLARVELQAIDSEIMTLRDRQKPPPAPPIPPQSLAAHVGIDADAPATARVSISYQIPNVSWEPFYYANLNSESGEFALTQYGEVRQRTGEDWLGVSLTLSTARPAVGAVLPKLTAWRLQNNSYEGLYQSDTTAAFSREDAEPRASKGPSVILPSVAQVEATEFAAEYHVPGKVNLISSESAQRIAVSESKLESHLAARIVPKLSLQAHLYSTAAYEGRDTLLPGPLTVFRDGSLLGTSSLPLLRPTEEFHLGFGADDKIRVEHIETPVDAESAGIFGGKRRIERQFMTKIANYHRQPIEITLLDQLPVSSEAITIELLQNSTAPSEKDWQDQDGVLAWTATYAPAEEKTINFGYAITCPQDMAIGVMTN